MNLEEDVYSVLIVSDSKKFDELIKEKLPESRFSPIKIVSSVAEARRCISEKGYDLTIINGPLPDDFGKKLAVDICSLHNAVAMLFVGTDIYDEIYSNVSKFGVFLMRKPISSQAVIQSIDHMCGVHQRLKKLGKKTLSMEEKLSEIRLVNHAKWALINSCRMSEEEAHKYIEKMAMDECVSRRVISERVLQTYK